MGTEDETQSHRGRRMAVLSQANWEEGDVGKTSPVDFRLVITYIGRYQRERDGFARRQAQVGWSN